MSSNYAYKANHSLSMLWYFDALNVFLQTELQTKDVEIKGKIEEIIRLNVSTICINRVSTIKQWIKQDKIVTFLLMLP